MNSLKYCMKTLTMSFCEWYCCIIHSCISSFCGKVTKSVEVYTQNLAPSWPELVPHRESITQWCLPSIHQSIYVWFCICSSCRQYVSDFQYHDCHGLNAGRSVVSLKQQKHSGILVARYPKIYPSEGGDCVTKIAPKSYQDFRYFLFINLLQFCQILSQIRVSHRNNN